MTSAQLLTRIQTLLDDAVSDHWSTTEIYAALTDGQRAFIKEVLSKFTLRRRIDQSTPLPEVLRPLLTTDTGTTTKSLPINYLLWVDVYGTSVPIYVREKGRGSSTRKNNTYLASSANQIYCSFNASQIVFETNTNWTLEYVKKPSDISASVNPTLDDMCMNAVIQFAFGFLLAKDKRTAEANNAFALFKFYIDQLY